MSALARYPDFLVIGAMKSGTTTLYRDLQAQPAIFVGEKEPNILLQSGPTDYSHFLNGAGESQLTGEVSPDYAKLPDRSAGVVGKVSALFFPRVVFIARHPIERLISHHAFDRSQQGRNTLGMPDSIDTAIRQCPQLIDYSSYAIQLKPWVETFGRDRIFFIKFEDYIANREKSLSDLCRWLGVSFDKTCVSQEVHNSGRNRPTATPGWRRLLDLPVYRRFVRTMLKESVRDRLRRTLLPAAKTEAQQPSPETLLYLKDRFQPDLEALVDLLQLDEIPWTLD